MTLLTKACACDDSAIFVMDQCRTDTEHIPFISLLSMESFQGSNDGETSVFSRVYVALLGSRPFCTPSAEPQLDLSFPVLGGKHHRLIG